MAHTSASLTFCLLLARAYNTLLRRFDGYLGTRHGLGFADFAVLLALHRAPAGKLRRVDLAAQLGVTASAVTRTLIPLEKIGLVKRQHDPRDARVGYATLTPAATRLLKEAVASAELISDEMFPARRAAQAREFSELLGDLAGA